MTDVTVSRGSRALRSINATQRRLEITIPLNGEFWYQAEALYQDCRKGEKGYSNARRLFQKWLEEQTGIFTYYPTDWMLSIEDSILDETLDVDEFVSALYGVTLLALNNRWYSEFTDCPDEWYERRNQLACQLDNASTEADADPLAIPFNEDDWKDLGEGDLEDDADPLALVPEDI